MIVDENRKMLNLLISKYYWKKLRKNIIIDLMILNENVDYMR
jgi:hypothetical protein